VAYGIVFPSGVGNGPFQNIYQGQGDCFRIARDGETIYGNFTRGGHNLTSRLGCRIAAMVLAAD